MRQHVLRFRDVQGCGRDLGARQAKILKHGPSNTTGPDSSSTEVRSRAAPRHHRHCLLTPSLHSSRHLSVVRVRDRSM